MKRLLSLLAAAGIALAAEAAPIELIAPQGGAQLEGGRETTLAWSAAELPELVEEWEAFLSLDGGQYYAIRITPHLDAATRSFRWGVPNVAASEARILIRASDEREEHIFEFPQSFRIVPSVAYADWYDGQVTLTEAGGEPALPMAPPTIEWVAGDRGGGGLVTHRHRDRQRVNGQRTLQDDAGTAPPNIPIRPLLQRPRSISEARISRSAVLIPERLCKPDPLLLLITRLNI